MVGWVLLIIGLVSFTVLLIWTKDEMNNNDDWVEASFVLSVGIVMISSFILFFAALFFNYETYEKEKVDIYSLNNNTEEDVSFTLGFGNVDEESYFYYFEENDEFESIKKIPTVDTKLIEEKVDHPYIIKYESRYTSEIAKWLFGEEGTLVFEGYKYELHVPENTITTDYNIDLEQ